MFRRSCKDLHQAIRLEVDGKLVDMPPVEGIIILNILRSVSGPVCCRLVSVVTVIHSLLQGER